MDVLSSFVQFREEQENLILILKALWAEHRERIKQLVSSGKLKEGETCITKPIISMMRHYPDMLRLGIVPEDYCD